MAWPIPPKNAPTTPGALSRTTNPNATTTRARRALTAEGRAVVWGPVRRPAERVGGDGRDLTRLGCTRPVLGARGRTWDVRPRRLVIQAIVADRPIRTERHASGGP